MANEASRTTGGLWRWVVGAGLALALLAGAAPVGAAEPEAGVVRPDAMTRLPDNSDTIGNNVYNTTASGQTRRRSAPAGTTLAYRFRMQNDSDTVQFLTPQGCAGNANFTVKYFLIDNDPLRPDINITNTIVQGGLAVGRNPGQSETYRVVVKIKPTAPAGAKLTCNLSVRISVKGPNDPIDVARIVVKRS